MLGDFGTEHRWTKTLRHCERDTKDVHIGTVRICTLPRPLMGRTEVREELTEYGPGEVLAYMLDGPAGPFSVAASRWSTRRVSRDSTLLTVEGRFTARTWGTKVLLWPVAKPMLRRLTSGVIRELEVFVIRERGHQPA